MVTLRIGDAKVTRIEETYAPAFPAHEFFPQWDPEVVPRHAGWMLPDHYEPATGRLLLSVHSWLIEAGGRRILVDTCVGNHKERASRPMWNRLQTPYLVRLAAAGVRPEDVDVVMCTHLHQDHVGWNTRLVDGRWQPTFPNAKYVFSRTEFEQSKARDEDPATGPANLGSFRDSILPVVEQGLAVMVDGDHALDEHLRLEPTPGHTPGHMAVHLSCGHRHAVFPGDAIHHAIQLYHPDWNSFACADAVLARASRRRLLEHCASSGAVLAPTHFGAPFACHVEQQGAAFRPWFVPTTA